MEQSTITHGGRVIATHDYNKITGWNVRLNKELNDEGKEFYKKIIEKMAEKHELKLCIE